jgi:hypothetical protein
VVTALEAMYIVSFGAARVVQWGHITTSLLSLLEYTTDTVTYSWADFAEIAYNRAKTT